MKLLPGALLALSLSGCYQKLEAQNTDSSEIITVTVDIIAKNRSEELAKYPKTKREEYYVTIDLTNTQDTIVPIHVMTCSWYEVFTTNGDSLHLKPTDCDSNFPTTLKIPAHKSVKFYATLVNNKSTKIGLRRSFKIGFVDFPFNDMFFAIRGTTQQNKIYKIYWSKNVDLVEKLDSYEISDKKQSN